YDEAVEIWRHVNVELPGNTGFLMDQAVLEMRVGEMRTADQLCADVLEIDPKNTRAMMLRADLAEMSDMSDISVERLQEVINQTQDTLLRSRLRVRMANRCSVIAKRKPGLYTDDFILDQIRLAIEENPAEVGTISLYAEKCLQAKRYAESKKWAVHVLEKHNRHNIRAKIALFELALVEQRYDDAEQILHDRYINYDPTDPLRYYFLARLYTASGDYQEALRCVDKLEAAGEQGCVLTLLYHDLTESDWVPVTSVRRLYEHLNALRHEGFTFISPTDIPEVIGLPPGVNRMDPEFEEDDEADDAPPWTAIMIDHVRYGITGERKFKSARKRAKKSKKPMKVVAVTFDDALRAAFTLGSQVAEEVGVPFGMFAITKPQEEYTPSVAGWAEMREYVAQGTWVIGSHLYGAHYDQAADAEGWVMRMSLPNRLWLKEKNRLESMNEWDRRMRGEFRKSRKIMKEQLGEYDSEVPMVAYPYGDVGQESACNLSLMRNPSQSIVAEAARNYKVGFVQGMSGYTTAGDNPMLSRRHEPNWYDEGADVVLYAYEHHPIFMARKMRVEIAFLMNKPHLAEDMLKLLRRDGYPEELCRKISIDVRTHFRNLPSREIMPLVASTTIAAGAAAGGGNTVPAYYGARPDMALADASGGFDPFAEDSAAGAKSSLGDMELIAKYQEGEAAPWMYLSNPQVGGEISHSKANDQFEIWRYGLHGGLNLNRNLILSGEYYGSRIEQRIRPRWSAVMYDRFDLKAYTFEALKREARGRLTYRTPGGVTISASLGMAKMRFDYDDDIDYIDDLFEDEVGQETFREGDESSELIGDVAASWSPRDNLSVYVYYARDLVMSSVKSYSSDSVGAIARWKPSDRWHVSMRGQYWSYEDDNAMFLMQGDSFWEMMPDEGFWFGLDASTVSSSEASDFYWTPYWDQRVMAILRYLQVRQGYSFRLDMLIGLQREQGRMPRREEEVDLSTAADWEYAWGFSSAYNKRLYKHLDLFVDANVMALREYIDHRFLLGFNLGF
ncbi:MAG: polysaccharide deacetylase family protein, partial [Kiritimatiellae bacterium]|nr:polysaccharide deacetylase family protein [Kiritimatiellia bacterium]